MNMGRAHTALHKNGELRQIAITSYFVLKKRMGERGVPD